MARAGSAVHIALLLAAAGAAGLKAAAAVPAGAVRDASAPPTPVSPAAAALVSHLLPPTRLSILDFGAVGDNATLNTRAIQDCIDAAAAVAGGAVVVVPPGVFATGTVSLASHVFLGFEDGAWLQGSGSPADYPYDWDYWHVVQGVNVSGAGVVGLGANAGTPSGGGIHGNLWAMVAGWNAAQGMWVPAGWSGVNGCEGECRVKSVAFIDATDVLLAGVALVDASDWTTLLRRTTRATVQDVYTRTPTTWPNGDGLDVESGRDITLTRLDTATGDDAVAVRSGNCNTMHTPWPEHPISPLRGLTLTASLLRSSSAAVKIENLFQRDHGNVSDIAVDGVTIYASNRGVGVWQRIAGPSGGWMGNISVSNTDIATSFEFGSAWWGSGEALVVTSVPETAAQAAVGLPGIHNISIVNVTARAANGALFSARDQAATNPAALTGLTLRNVTLTIARAPGTQSTWAQHDFRPVDAGAPSPPTIPALVDGLVFEHVAGAVLTNVSVTFAPPALPYYDGAGGVGVCINATADSVVSNDGFSCALA